MMGHDAFSVELEHRGGYRFDVDFGLPGVPLLSVDEAPPLGEGHGPAPTRLLAAAVGNCLAASLVFCLSRARVELHGLRVRVEGELVRNERERLRVGGLKVRLEPVIDPAHAGRLDRCLGRFEDFCIVGQSVQAGIPLEVEVRPELPAPATAA